MEDYHIHTLPNGIQVVHKQVPHTKIAHCGFTLDIGSRDESHTSRALPISGNTWPSKELPSGSHFTY